MQHMPHVPKIVEELLHFKPSDRRSYYYLQSYIQNVYDVSLEFANGIDESFVDLKRLSSIFQRCNLQESERKPDIVAN